MQKLNISELLNPPVIPFVPNHTKTDWHRFVSSHQLFTDDRFIEDVCIPINLSNGHTCDWVIPSREVLFDLVHDMGQKVVIDLVLLKIIEIWSYVTKNDRKINPQKVVEYRNAIKNHLYGKQGLLSKMSTAIVPVVQAKQVSFGFIPTGTVIVISEEFWRTVHKKGRDGEWADMEYDEFKRRMHLPIQDPEALQFFGFKERHPVIWALQEANAVSIWSKDRLNKYMIDRYGYSFYDYAPYFRSAKEEAIIANTLDSLLFHQEDSDGDMGIIPMYFDTGIQNKIEEINRNGKNYDFFYSDAYKPIKQLTTLNFKWHFSYLLAEVQGNSSHGFKSKDPEFKTQCISANELTEAYLNAISAKHSIGTVSTSNWFIQRIASYLCKNGKITFTQFLQVSDFYQKIIVQDGVIRSVKHVAGVGMHNLTLDALTINSKDNVINTGHGKYLPQAYLEYLIRDANYPEDTIETFNKVLLFWRKNSGFNKGKIDPRKTTDLGKLIKASVALCFGAKASLGKNDDLISCFKSEEIETIPIYRTHKEIIDLLNSVDDKISVFLKDNGENIF